MRLRLKERNPAEVQPKLVPPPDGSEDRVNKLFSSLKARKVKLATCYIQKGDRLAQNYIRFMQLILDRAFLEIGCC